MNDKKTENLGSRREVTEILKATERADFGVITYHLPGQTIKVKL